MEGFLDYFCVCVWVLAQKYVGEKRKQRVPYPKQILLLYLPKPFQKNCTNNSDKERQGGQVSTPPSGSSLVLEQDMERDRNKPLN